MQYLLVELSVCFDVDVLSLSDMSGEVQRVRPSRFLHPDGIIRPFVYHDAEGNQILQVHCNTHLTALPTFLCVCMTVMLHVYTFCRTVVLFIAVSCSLHTRTVTCPCCR